jgi:hypothetical protein
MPSGERLVEMNEAIRLAHLALRREAGKGPFAVRWVCRSGMDYRSYQGEWWDVCNADHDRLASFEIEAIAQAFAWLLNLLPEPQESQCEPRLS